MAESANGGTPVKQLASRLATPVHPHTRTTVLLACDAWKSGSVDVMYTPVMPGGMPRQRFMSADSSVCHVTPMSQKPACMFWGRGKTRGRTTGIAGVVSGDTQGATNRSW